MDPGVPEAREHSLAVIRDVVRRYDVDGVHIDDYFYPYPERDTAGALIPFPDEPSWARYREGGGRLERDDWRRDNVDGFVRDLYRTVHETKPWVRVGISPFGVYRPNHPPGQGTAFDQYAELYADPRRWLHEGWLDYMTPQLYWPISRPDLSYPVLLRWWTEENLLGRHLWPGNYTSRTVVGAPTPWRAREVTDQIWVTRGFAGATGNVHFSMRAFTEDPGSLGARLLAGPYRARALPPATPWLGGDVLPAPAIELRRGVDGGAVVAIEPRGEQPRWWIVRVRDAAGWRVEVLPGAALVHPLPGPAAVLEVAVSAVDRLATEGRAARLRP
jgi:uncharacterized lipoprotein YddW (UPF0748 family)